MFGKHGAVRKETADYAKVKSTFGCSLSVMAEQMMQADASSNIF